MELIYMGLKHGGVRFLTNIKKYLEEEISKDILKYFYEKREFMGYLANRLDYYDVVFISAHGSEGEIIKYSHRDGKYHKYIKSTQTKYFKNNFIMSVACLTATEFGEQAIEQGAISFMGYTTSLEQLISVHYYKELLPYKRQLLVPYEIIMKKIYVEALGKSLHYFLSNCCTVLEMKERISFLYENKIMQLEKMNSEEIKRVYQVIIDGNLWTKYKPILIMNNLFDFKEINNKLVIKGDKNYRSTYAFDNYCKLKKEDILKLKNLSFPNKEYDTYFKNGLKSYLSYSDEVASADED